MIYTPSIYARSKRTPVRQYVSDSHDDRKTLHDVRGDGTMPLTAKGMEIKKALTGEYGEEKGEQVLYAGKNKGTFTGIDAEETAGEQASEDARMSAIEGRLSEVEGKKDAVDVFDSIPAGLDCAKLDAACSMMDSLGKRFDAFCEGRKDSLRLTGQDKYEFTHGKKPSGSGNWAFKVEGESKIVFLSGTLSECKAELTKRYPKAYEAEIQT